MKNILILVLTLTGCGRAGDGPEEHPTKSQLTGNPSEDAQAAYAGYYEIPDEPQDISARAPAPTTPVEVAATPETPSAPTPKDVVVLTKADPESTAVPTPTKDIDPRCGNQQPTRFVDLTGLYGTCQGPSSMSWAALTCVTDSDTGAVSWSGKDVCGNILVDTPADLISQRELAYANVQR